MREICTSGSVRERAGNRWLDSALENLDVNQRVVARGTGSFIDFSSATRNE